MKLIYMICGLYFFYSFFNMYLFKIEWNFIVNIKVGELLV